jgi:sulfite reductase (NADPH) hemoprotein beta-component
LRQADHQGTCERFIDTLRRVGSEPFKAAANQVRARSEVAT